MPSGYMCPHCNQRSELVEGNVSTNTQTASLNLWGLEDRIANERKSFFIETRLYTCAHCGRSSIFLIVRTNYREPKGIYITSDNPTMIWRRHVETFQVFPPAKPLVREWPDTVPRIVNQDYTEAYLIKDISPRASATLARRCLQGMIRDKFKVSLNTLNNEIQKVKKIVDRVTGDALDAIRQIGNIGAHPEEDINLVIEITKDDAALLLEFVERLIEDWYITGPGKEELPTMIIEMAKMMQEAKKTGAAPAGADAE
jgi:Domain of unknown function (DUF4145)